MSDAEYESENEEMELDLDWINNFEKDNDIYDKFTLRNISEITLNVVYLDKEENIQDEIKSIIKLKTNNLIKKEELLYQITNNKKNYKLHSMIVYNMDITNIKDMDEIDGNKYLKNQVVIDDIELSPTMLGFHNLNTLYIFYIEKEIVKKCQTKKIHYTPAPKNQKFTKHNRKELKKTD